MKRDVRKALSPQVTRAARSSMPYTKKSPDTIRSVGKTCSVAAERFHSLAATSECSHATITCARSPSTDDDFDWAHCIRNAHPQDQWIGCAIGLARETLGRHIQPEAAPYESPLPRWLVPAVFVIWVRSAEHGLDERWALREFLE